MISTLGPKTCYPWFPNFTNKFPLWKRKLRPKISKKSSDGSTRSWKCTRISLPIICSVSTDIRPKRRWLMRWFRTMSSSHQGFSVCRRTLSSNWPNISPLMTKTRNSQRPYPSRHFWKSTSPTTISRWPRIEPRNSSKISIFRTNFSSTPRKIPT